MNAVICFPYSFLLTHILHIVVQIAIASTSLLTYSVMCMYHVQCTSYTARTSYII